MEINLFSFHSMFNRRNNVALSAAFHVGSCGLFFNLFITIFTHLDHVP